MESIKDKQLLNYIETVYKYEESLFRLRKLKQFFIDHKDYYETPFIDTQKNIQYSNNKDNFMKMQGQLMAFQFVYSYYNADLLKGDFALINYCEYKIKNYNDYDISFHDFPLVDNTAKKTVAQTYDYKDGESTKDYKDLTSFFDYCRRFMNDKCYHEAKLIYSRYAESDYSYHGKVFNMFKGINPLESEKLLKCINETLPKVFMCWFYVYLNINLNKYFSAIRTKSNRFNHNNKYAEVYVKGSCVAELFKISEEDIVESFTKYLNENEEIKIIPPNILNEFIEKIRISTVNITLDFLYGFALLGLEKYHQIELFEKHINHLDDCVDDNLDKINKYISKYENNLNSLYQANLINKEYRNFLCIAKIKDLFNKGIVNKLEGNDGAYKIIYDDKKFNLLIDDEENIFKHLDEIKKEQPYCYEVINNCIQLLEQLDSYYLIPLDQYYKHISYDKENNTLSFLDETVFFKLVLDEMYSIEELDVQLDKENKDFSDLVQITNTINNEKLTKKKEYNVFY